VIEARLTEKADLPAILEVLKEPGNMKWIFHDPAQLNMENLPGILLGTPGGTTSKAFTLIVKDEPVGVVTLTDIHPIHRSVKVGLWALAKRAQGRRYGFWVWNFVTSYAFETLNLNRIWGYVLPDNRVVMGIYAKLGGSCEGIARQSLFKEGEYTDVHIYALLKEEWKQNAARCA